MNSLLRQFENLGLKDIRSKFLTYFTNGLDREIDYQSRVFANPKTPDLVTLNKISIKVALRDNWDFVKQLYPCLPEFKYVISTIDAMYEIRFPYHDVHTGEVFGVETVEDYIIFLWTLIINICRECISEKSCDSPIDKKILGDKLEECRGNITCSVSRERALEYFLSYVSQRTAQSSVEIHGGDVQTDVTVLPQTRLLTNPIHNKYSDWHLNMKKFIKKNVGGGVVVGYDAFPTVREFKESEGFLKIEREKGNPNLRQHARNEFINQSRQTMGLRLLFDESGGLLEVNRGGVSSMRAGNEELFVDTGKAIESMVDELEHSGRSGTQPRGLKPATAEAQ